ncbi:MFS general substrate transporter [Lojkania enalia]|uniref:MFS general substrate transporter n=1 Tax=Lojkania enalia TaxID=147567 RepID=A0A9P4K495_9PLEO|nr:MFS general substrate transporter [Didymosphaeria enalia]
MAFSSHVRGLRARLYNAAANPPKLLYVFFLIVFLELEESVQRAPTIRILENAVCQQHYRTHPISHGIEESMCKTAQIQSKLAHVRGILSFFDALPVILLGSFFGSLADRKGRRLPFALAACGIICQMAWIYFTAYMWDRIPIEVVWVSSAFRLIGGGPNLAIALCLTIASDLSTDDTRSKYFYRVFTASLVTDLVGPPIAYTTLKSSLWLPYLVCGISLLCTFPVLLKMPETLASNVRQHADIEGPVERTGITAYLQFLKDWRILVGVATVFLAQFRNNTIEILLPYTSIRFGLELGETAMLLSVVSAVNIVVFLILLPAATTFLQENIGLSSHLVNMYVARTSSAMLTIGAAILAAAPNVGIVVFALIVYATGFGVRLSILAVLTACVSSTKETARLYTLVATTDAVAHMIASPSLQWVWGRALHIGGRWVVLPFLVLMVSSLLIVHVPKILRLSGHFFPRLYNVMSLDSA